MLSTWGWDGRDSSAGKSRWSLYPRSKNISAKNKWGTRVKLKKCLISVSASWHYYTGPDPLEPVDWITDPDPDPALFIRNTN